MALPFSEPRISLLDPGEFFGPFIRANEKVGQIPFIGVRQVGAGENFWSGHWQHEERNVQRPTLLRKATAAGCPTSNVELKGPVAAVCDRRTKFAFAWTASRDSAWRDAERLIASLCATIRCQAGFGAREMHRRDGAMGSH